MGEKKKWQKEVEAILGQQVGIGDIRKALDLLFEKVQTDDDLFPPEELAHLFKFLFDSFLHHHLGLQAMRMAFLLGAAWGKYRDEALSREGWIIHHLNGIKDDNRPENLVALPRRTHDGSNYIRYDKVFLGLVEEMQRLQNENTELRKALLWKG